MPCHTLIKSVIEEELNACMCVILENTSIQPRMHGRLNFVLKRYLLYEASYFRESIVTVFTWMSVFRMGCG